jgi:hypothetical protein
MSKKQCKLPAEPREQSEQAIELIAACEELIGLMDSVEIDPNLGDESDRVFPHYEFDRLRAALVAFQNGRDDLARQLEIERTNARSNDRELRLIHAQLQTENASLKSQAGTLRLKAGDTLFRDDGKPREVKLGEQVRWCKNDIATYPFDRPPKWLFQVVTRIDITAEMLGQSVVSEAESEVLAFQLQADDIVLRPTRKYRSPREGEYFVTQGDSFLRAQHNYASSEKQCDCWTRIDITAEMLGQSIASEAEQPGGENTT